MRRKVRGLRTIEQVVLRRQKAQTQEDLTGVDSDSREMVSDAVSGVESDRVARDS